LESYGLSRRPPLAQRSVKVGKVAFLEGRLFGEDGCLRRGLTDELVAMLLGEINELRHDLGWLRLDLRTTTHGRQASTRSRMPAPR
jgi:hypothetical protein